MIHLDRSHSYTVYVKFHLPAAAENPGLDLGRARLGSGFDHKHGHLTKEAGDLIRGI